MTRELTYQVRVVCGEKGHPFPITEHLVEVLATSEQEARLVACQIAACRTDMPLSAETLWDETLG